MTLSLPWLGSLFFIMIRLGTLLLFTPIQAIRQLTIPTRLILIFTFSLLLINYVPDKPSMENSTLFLASVAEFSNGLILSMSLYAAFAVFQIAGQIIENQIGLNSLAFFNPGEHSQEPLTSHLLSMLAVLFFFGLDGHLWLFKGLAYSFVIIPPGTIAVFAGFTPIIKQFSFMFTIALMLASPIILALVAIDLCGAIITRNMPQINTYFLTLPLKILFGLSVLAMMLGYLKAPINLIFEHCFQTWQEVMS